MQHVCVYVTTYTQEYIIPSIRSAVQQVYGFNHMHEMK